MLFGFVSFFLFYGAEVFLQEGTEQRLGKKPLYWWKLLQESCRMKTAVLSGESWFAIYSNI